MNNIIEKLGITETSRFFECRSCDATDPCILIISDGFKPKNCVDREVEEDTKPQWEEV